MKILVFGSGGTLGQSFHALKGNTEHTFVLAGRADADVELIDEVRALFRAHQPDAAVNLAAKTNLDARLPRTPARKWASRMNAIATKATIERTVLWSTETTLPAAT